MQALTYTEYQERRYIPELDGLRALAVALVVTCHLHTSMWQDLSGYVGVTIFFILSGYLITAITLRELRKTGTVSFKAFYIRRTFRIFPLYYFVLALYAILIFALRLWPDKIAPFHVVLPYYLVYFQEVPFWMHIGNLQQLPPFYQTWSLGIEEKFYLLWPFILTGLLRVVRRWRIAAVSSFVVVCTAQGLLSEKLATYHLEHYGFILMGCVLALLLADQDIYRQVLAWTRRTRLVALLLVLITQFYLMPYKHLRGLDTLYAVSASVLIVELITVRRAINSLLCSKLLVLVGRLSYGIYLLHILCIGAVEKVFKPQRGLPSDLLAYFGTLVLAILVSYVLHRLIELPMIRFGRQWSSEMKAGGLDR